MNAKGSDRRVWRALFERILEIARRNPAADSDLLLDELEDDELTPEEALEVQRGQEQLARGESITLDELRRQLGR